MESILDFNDPFDFKKLINSETFIKLWSIKVPGMGKFILKLNQSKIII